MSVRVGGWPGIAAFTASGNHNQTGNTLVKLNARGSKKGERRITIHRPSSLSNQQAVLDNTHTSTI
jgi:hypothetical protein